MKRLKKILAMVSIVAILLSGFITALSIEPKRAAAEEEVGVSPSMETVSLTPEAQNEASESEVLTTGTVCEAPGTSEVVVNDGLGNDINYFKDATQISFNWSGFSSTNCPVVRYKYAVWEVDASNHATTKIVSGMVDDSITAMTVDQADFLTPLIEGNKYRVKILAKARVAGSDGVWSEPIWSDGQRLDSTAPTMNYFALSQDRPYGGSLGLQFSANDLNGIKSYQIYRNDFLIDTVTGATNTYVENILGDNDQFVYFITATDEAGNLSDPSNLQSVLVDNVAPSAPSISYWIGGKNVTLFWGAMAATSTYEVYRNGTLVYAGPETKFTDNQTVRGETYSYTVYALDGAGNKSLASNTLEIYIPKPQVSSAVTIGTVQGTSTGTAQQSDETVTSPSPSPSTSGEVQASETAEPEEETADESKTNWSLIIAIIIAAGIVVAGVLYWWYAREDEDEI